MDMNNIGKIRFVFSFLLGIGYDMKGAKIYIRRAGLGNVFAIAFDAGDYIFNEFAKSL